MMLSSTYWSDRYRSHNTPWDLGKVSSPLKSIIDSLEDKSLKILIPGAGNSHEARYLLEKGFTRVKVLDYAMEPLELLSRQVGNSQSIRVLQEDFFNSSGSYDLILEQTFFCALELRFRESYKNKMLELLNHNGSLRGVLFNFQGARKEPPYGGSKEEYRLLFKEGFHILRLDESQISEPSRKGKELLIHLKKRSNDRNT